MSRERPMTSQRQAENALRYERTRGRPIETDVARQLATTRVELEEAQAKLAKATAQRDAYRAVVMTYIAGFGVASDEELFEELADCPETIVTLKSLRAVVGLQSLYRKGELCLRSFSITF